MRETAGGTLSEVGDTFLWREFCSTKRCVFLLFSALKRQPARATKHIKHQKKFFSAFLVIFASDSQRFVQISSGHLISARHTYDRPGRYTVAIKVIPGPKADGLGRGGRQPHSPRAWDYPGSPASRPIAKRPRDRKHAKLLAAHEATHKQAKRLAANKAIRQQALRLAGKKSSQENAR